MTSETTYREKGRAVVLSALMVLSVVAMSAAFAGGAAAVNTDQYDTFDEDYDVGPTYDETQTDKLTPIWIGQEVTITGPNLGDYAGYEIRAGSDPSNSESSDSIDDGSIDGNSFTIDTEDYDERFHHIVLVGSGSSNWDDVVFRTESEKLDTSFKSETVTDGEDPVLNYESEREEQIVNVTETEAGLDAEEIAATFTHASGVSDLNPSGNLHNNDDVATLAIDGVTNDGERDITLGTSELDTGSYNFEFNHTDSLAADNASLEIQDDDRDRSVESVTGERGNLVNITANLDDLDDGVLQVGDYDDSDYEAGLHIQDDTDSDEELGDFNITMNTHKAGGGHISEAGVERQLANLIAEDNGISTLGGAVTEYESNNAVTYTSYSSTSSTDPADYDGNVHYFPTDDNVWTSEDDVTVTLQYLNTTSDDTLYVNENTDAGLSDGDSKTVSDLKASSDTVDLASNGIPASDTLGSPLGATDFETNIGNDFAVTGTAKNVELANSDDSSFLTLSEKSGATGVATHTAPEDDDMGDLEDFEDATVTTTDSVAKNDHMLVTIDDFGSTGALDDYSNGDDIGQVLAAGGVYLEMEQQGVPSHSSDKVWNNSGVDSDYLALEFVNADDYEGDQLILNVSYLEKDNVHLNEDESYDWTLTSTDESPYVAEDEGSEVEGELTLNEREVTIDDTHETIPNSADATVGGDTTVAPGTEVTVRASSSGNFVEDPATEVTSDRGFNVSYDFSEYEANLSVDLEATEAGGASDTLEAELIDAEAPQPLSYDVSTDPAEPVVGDNVTGTIAVENPNDDQPVAEDVEFVFDGETLYNDTVDLKGGASTSVDATLLETAEKGEYEWELIVDGETEESGTLTVSDDGSSDDGSSDDGSSDDGSSDDGSSDDGSSDDGSSDDGSSDDGSSDGTPGFGVGVALVALLGAAMLALRRQN